MKLDFAIRELHRSEEDLAQELVHAAERHKTDHEVFYVARDIAAWSVDHVQELAHIGSDYGLELDAEADVETGVARRLRETSAELLGRRPEPALLMLRDLRQIYIKASGVSLDWELLGQAAQGARERELLTLAERCHPETLRQMRWANSKLKISSTQALIS